MLEPRGPQPPTYDPARLALEAKAQGWRYIQRQVAFSWLLARLAFWVAFCFATPKFKRKPLYFARWARLQMVKRGAAFIKLGQVLSSRVDAFPEEVILELSKLQDKVPGFPFAAVRHMVEADLGMPLETAFIQFDPTPLAAASMGQVHPATLPSGEAIVVKVLRPGLEADLALDLTLMRRFAGWLGTQAWLLKLLRSSADTPWVGLIDHLGKSMYQQLDLWAEGLAGERFRANFKDCPEVSAPAIYFSHSSTRLLTQERIYGFRFDEEQAIRDAGIDFAQIAKVSIRAFTKQVFEDRFFHADGHPGNIFVTPEGKLIFLDFGMVEEIDDDFQTALIEMFIHAIQQDWSAFLEDMVQTGIIPAEVPREELLPIFSEVWAAQLGFTEKRYTLQDMADAFYAVIRRYPFRLPERFLFLTRTAAALEGVVYRVDPGFKFLPVAMPYFAKFILQKIDPEHPWILDHLLQAARSGDGLERLGGIARMALADEPEQLHGVLNSLLEVALHSRSAPLRNEIAERLLNGEFQELVKPMLGALPANFTFHASALQQIERFLRSPDGRAFCVSVLEDPRFSKVAAQWLQGGSLPTELPLDWLDLFLHWFPAGPERKKAYRIVHRLLESPEFPWSTMLSPFSVPQLTGTVPRARHLPALLGFLGHEATWPLLAKGVLKGVTDRLSGRSTGPLLGERPWP